mgnify:CR=1 FL=1
MSRKGNSPITLPPKVTWEIKEKTLIAQGQKGKIESVLPGEYTLSQTDQTLSLAPLNKESEGAKYGLAWTVVTNTLVGCSTGFEKKLSLIGVGYRADVKGENVDLQLGFSHPTLLPIPAGIEVKVEKSTTVIISGTDKQKVGQFAANIRSIRPPEPYKGKGVRYVDEFVRRKAGKTSKK